MLLQCVQRFGGKIDVFLVFLVRLAEKVLGEQSHIFPSLRKRGQSNGNDIQAIEQVLSKPTRVDLSRKVSIGRGDHSHVDRKFALGAEPAYRAFLQRAQEFGLHG
ncbi:hypothetical protein SDC9_94964 [bioreactor metagenome]|uniref:Uncharacterized protein n=1 Tax=bioreactor metagenome TaxID=1076179 RepID=A0A645A4W9_9ZZZZ